MRPFKIERLPGLTSYEAARALQLDTLQKRIRDQVPDTFFALEHEAVVTRGRGLQRKLSGLGSAEVPSVLDPTPRAMPLGALPEGIAYAESERGGDLTYHGPGQLVIYPVVKLDGGAPWAPSHDIGKYLRWLERSVARVLERQGLETEARPEATGVWCRKPAQGAVTAVDVLAGKGAGEFKKIASIGIAARSWVTYHGIAINLVNDLAPFRLISPCGFSPEVMTSAREMGLVQNPDRALDDFLEQWSLGVSSTS